MFARLLTVVWALVLLSLCVTPACARWQKIAAFEAAREPSFHGRVLLSRSTFLDDNLHGWSAGVTVYRPKTVVVIRTVDGGETWERIETGVRATYVYDIEFVDGNNGWMVTSDGMLMRTLDGGRTWRYEEMPGGGEANDITDVEMLSAQHGFAVGSAEGEAALFEYRVTRGGRPPWWTVYPVGCRGSIGRLVVHSTDWMWMLRGDVRGTDVVAWRRAGSSELVPITGLHDLTCVWAAFFISPERGWLGGLWGDIWRTDDGGLTWASQDPSAERAIKGIWFTSPTEGMAVSGNGEILATSNGGDDWRMVTNLRSSSVDLDYFNGKYIVTNVAGLYHDAPLELRLAPLTPLRRAD